MQDTTVRESEMYVMGTCINDNKYMLKAMDQLDKEDFYSEKHKLIYGTMEELLKRNIRFDIEVLAHRLKNEIENNVISVSELSNISLHTAYQTFASHVSIVKEDSLNRKINLVCKNLIDSKEPTSKKIEILQNTLLDISASRGKDKYYSASEVMEMTINKIERAYKTKDGITGISTGIRKIDNVTNGLERKEFIIFGARPSMGKSALSLALLDNIKAKVLYIQLDMSLEGMGQRMLASDSYIENGRIGRGRINDKEWEVILKSFGRISKKKNINFYTPPKVTVNQIRLKAKEMQIKQGLDVIIIDHIGKIKPTTRGTRYEQMSEISNQLKAIAKELNVCMVGLCQLSRATEQRQDKRPMLSDLRDTGSIEEDADVIGLLYRNGYYQDSDRKQEIKEDELEINFAKNRNGRVGNIKLRYNLTTQRLSEF